MYTPAAAPDRFPRKAKREYLFFTMVGGTRQSPLEAVSRITNIA
jgi:hypothetical protein